MAGKPELMAAILKQHNLGNLVEEFQKEKITPDIVSLSSVRVFATPRSQGPSRKTIKSRSTLGRVVQKPVKINVNPGISVNCSIIFYCLKMSFTRNVWWSLKLLQLKVPLWSNPRYPLFYIFVHIRSSLAILQNFYLLRTLQRAVFGPLFLII